MFESDGAGLTYAVVTDELVRAASAVMQITASAKDATIETLPQVISTAGHGRLEVTFRDFCARWDTGLSHLVGDSETMSVRLDSCAQGYVENEDTAHGDYQQLMSCTPPTPPTPPPDARRMVMAGTGQGLGPHRPPRPPGMSAQLEADLASGAPPEVLVPGDLPGFALAADTLRGHARLLEGTGDSLSRVDVANWRGQASTGFSTSSRSSPADGAPPRTPSAPRSPPSRATPRTWPRPASSPGRRGRPTSATSRCSPAPPCWRASPRRCPAPTPPTGSWVRRTGSGSAPATSR